MWHTRPPGSPWTNPCGAITLTPEVQAQYQLLFDAWQRHWYATWPDLDADPRWFARPNPPAALAYPPGFLKRGLEVVVLITPSAPDTDGYFWANDRVFLGVDSYQALRASLSQ